MMSPHIPKGKISAVAKKKKNNEQLPEGMSRRQAKLAARAAERAKLQKDPRPYDGFAMEADLIALQEFVPSAYFTPEVKGIDRKVNIASVLPGAVAALLRSAEDGGEAFVALQTQHRGNNPHRDLAYVLNWVKNAEPGQSLEVGIADAVLPSHRIEADIKGAAWWIDPSEKAHIRWVRQEDENQLLDALARLHAAGELHLGEGSKFAGVFRTHGVLVPVWDLDNTKEYNSWSAGLEALDKKLDEALGSSDALTADEQKAKQTIISREVTIR